MKKYIIPPVVLTVIWFAYITAVSIQEIGERVCYTGSKYAVALNILWGLIPFCLGIWVAKGIVSKKVTKTSALRTVISNITDPFKEAVDEKLSTFWVFLIVNCFLLLGIEYGVQLALLKDFRLLENVASFYLGIFLAMVIIYVLYISIRALSIAIFEHKKRHS